MHKAIVKEGPLVFIRNFLVMELLATVILYAASFLENYEQIYQGSIFGKAVNYDTFLMIIFSLFQFVYITLLFLDWYFSLYEVGEKEIIRRSGLLFRHRKSVSLSDVTSVELYQSPLSRIMFHGTIILEHKSGRV